MYSIIKWIRASTRHKEKYLQGGDKIDVFLLFVHCKQVYAICFDFYLGHQANSMKRKVLLMRFTDRRCTAPSCFPLFLQYSRVHNIWSIIYYVEIHIDEPRWVHCKRPLIQFHNDFSQLVGHLELVISPPQGRYLRTGQHKHRINAYTH
jgi:hypothetical protein